MIDSGRWRSGLVTIEAYSEELGDFEYALTLFDKVGNSHEDRVIVTFVDTTAPILEHLDDVVLLADVGALNLSWNAFDYNPLFYQIWSNESLVKSGDWNSSSESFSVYEASLPAGMYNYTLNVTDLFGHSSCDSVIVTAEYDFDAPSITGPTTIEFTEGTVGNHVWWLFHDKYPANYTVFLNGSIVLEDTWNATHNSISIRLDSLEVGVYNYTILVTDISNNSNSAMTMVTVNPVPVITPTTPTTPTTSPTPTNGTGESLLPVLTVAVGVIGAVAVLGLIANVLRKDRELDWARRLDG